MKRFAPLPVLVAATFLLQSFPSSASTVAVGNCRRHLMSYHTISEAIAAVAAGSTVLVCPGVYPEEVTITTSLTLRGVVPTTSRTAAVITVPSGGLSGPQVLVMPSDITNPPVVNISNIVVDGTGSTNGTGIGYLASSGNLNGLEVRNQAFGIDFGANPLISSLTVNLQNSYIHDFDNTGVTFGSGGQVSSFLNITKSIVKSNKATVLSGILYDFVGGEISESVILLQTGIGLQLKTVFNATTVQKNTITGADTGITMGPPLATLVIADNNLFGNATGISAFGPVTINANLIGQSSATAIDLNCFTNNTVSSNIIYGTPVGITNVQSGDTITSNKFINVGADTVGCQ